MSYTLSKGYRIQDDPKDWDDHFYNWLVDYGMTHEAFIPGLGMYRQYQERKPRQAVGSIVLPLATAYGVTYWATGQAFQSVAVGGFTAMTGTTPGAILAPVAIVGGVTAATYFGTQEFIGFHEAHQPSEPTQQSSYWRSISAALTGGFVAGVDVR